MNIAKEKITQFNSLTEQSNNVALFCHISPDADTIGSALALAIALENINKKVRIFCDDDIPSKLYELNAHEKVEKPDKVSAKEFDLAIAIDCADFTRLGNGRFIFERIKNTIAIDHHISHVKFSNLTIMEDVSATAEIVFKLLEDKNLIDNKIAKNLFGALISDNGCFTYSSTTANSHNVAEKLYKFDFDKSETIYNIFRKKSLQSFLLKQKVLSKTKFYLDNKLAIISFFETDFQSTNTTSSDTDGIVSELMNIDVVEVGIAISQVSEYSYKISFRTKDSVNASDCASCFGGGGHKNAAGCRTNGHYEDILDKLMKIVGDRL